MIRFGELAQYLRLLLELTMLDSQRKCSILNRLKIDIIVDVQAHQKNCSHHLKQKTPIHCQDLLSNISPRKNGTGEDLDEDVKSRNSPEIKRNKARG
jgi:hypothetical protein